MLSYHSMAITNQGIRLGYHGFDSAEEALHQFEVWGNEYGINFRSTWIDVYDSAQKVKRLSVAKKWVPESENGITDGRKRTMPELRPCPFCGCNMVILKDTYPDGSDRIEPYGYHEENCILSTVLWCTYPEDGWTVEKIESSWNGLSEEI